MKNFQVHLGLEEKKFTINVKVTKMIQFFQLLKLFENKNKK